MGLSSTVAATWGNAGTRRKGWKIKSETRREPGCASKICAPQTPKSKQFTHKLFSCTIHLCLSVQFMSWMFIDFFFYYIFLFVFFLNSEGLKDMFTTSHNSQKYVYTKNNEQTIYLLSSVCVMCVFILSFRSHISSSSGMVICPLHACLAQQGSPGRTNPRCWVWTNPNPTPHSVCLLLSHYAPAFMPRQSALWPGYW